MRSSAMSRSLRCRRYRSIDVSEWCAWNTGCVMNGEVRRSACGDRHRRSRLPSRPSTPNADAHRVDGDPTVVVSSSAIATRSSSTRADVHAVLDARPRTISSARPGTRTVIVSKNASMLDRDASAFEGPRRVSDVERVDPAGDALAARRGRGTRRTSTGDDREQHLRGADVARRLLAADVLLARLQREPERGAARRRRLDTPTRRPGSVALVRRRGRDERGVRPAEAERDAEPLRRSDDDVRAMLARAG